MNRKQAIFLGIGIMIVNAIIALILSSVDSLISFLMIFIIITLAELALTIILEGISLFERGYEWLGDK